MYQLYLFGVAQSLVDSWVMENIPVKTIAWQVSWTISQRQFINNFKANGMYHNELEQSIAHTSHPQSAACTCHTDY